MEKAIYYPGFEVQDVNWLKFALLYIDRLNPIIPRAGDKYRTELYDKLYNETDLIDPHRPDMREGQAATLDATELVSNILRNPKVYSATLSTTNVSELWKDQRKWDYTLFEDKYTHDWEDFCIDNRLATRSYEGLKLQKSLGLVYMSLLAHAISEQRGICTLTDHPEMDQIAIIIRKSPRLTLKRAHVAHGTITLHLPSNLSGINIDKVIKHRARPEFKNRLHAFHQELEVWMAKVEKGETQGDFLSTRGTSFSEFSADLMKLGAGLVSFGLGVWLMLSKPATTLAYFEKIAAGSALTIGSAISLRSTWKNTHSTRLTRKYLADLKRIS